MTTDDVWSAVRRGDLDAVRAFVARDGVPDIEDNFEPSLLTVACEAGNLEVVRLVWENQPRLRPQYAPEAFAALRCGHLDVLRLLLEFGADAWGAGEFSRHGPSLLDEAVQNRNVEVVLLLLEFDFDVETWISMDLDEHLTEEEAQSDRSPPAIELAARAGDVELTRFLLAIGAKLEGQSPESYLEKARQNEEQFRQKVALQADEAALRQPQTQRPLESTTSDT